MTTQAPVPRRDWLLTCARWLVNLIIVLVCLGGLAVILAALAFAVPPSQTWISTSIVADTGKPIGTEIIVAILALLACIVAMSVIAFHWLIRLRRIIDSVGHGHAFSTANAQRLATMGWLTVGLEALSIPAGAAAVYVTTHFGKSHINIGLSLGGILMALVLFILARVFREGANMREELEGTV